MYADLNCRDWRFFKARSLLLFVDRLRRLPKICPHFHLSLQSGCDETLKRMNRPLRLVSYICIAAAPHPAPCKRNDTVGAELVGCYVQTGTQEGLREAGVDLAVGNNKKGELVSLLEAFLEM